MSDINYVRKRQLLYTDNGSYAHIAIQRRKPTGWHKLGTSNRHVSLFLLLSKFPFGLGYRRWTNRKWTSQFGLFNCQLIVPRRFSLVFHVKLSVWFQTVMDNWGFICVLSWLYIYICLSLRRVELKFNAHHASCHGSKQGRHVLLHVARD